MKLNLQQYLYKIDSNFCFLSKLLIIIFPPEMLYKQTMIDLTS